MKLDRAQVQIDEISLRRGVRRGSPWRLTWKAKPAGEAEKKNGPGSSPGERFQKVSSENPVPSEEASDGD